MNTRSRQRYDRSIRTSSSPITLSRGLGLALSFALPLLTASCGREDCCVYPKTCTFMEDADGDGYAAGYVSKGSTDNDCGIPFDTQGFKSTDQDCDDKNASIHPGAQEQAGDKVDSNCDGDPGK